MHDVYELGIIGMGPAGIGLAMSIKGFPIIKNTICFERGNDPTSLCCPIVSQSECCSSDSCGVISGVGGASVFSGGKISDYPAGSGLLEFFDSEAQLRNMMNRVVQMLDNRIQVSKIEINELDIFRATTFYKGKNIDYKYYDVYEFDRREYQALIQDLVAELEVEGLELHRQTEVLDVSRDPASGCFQLKVKSSNEEKQYRIRNLVFASGALDIQDALIEKTLGPITNNFEIGVRVEAPSTSLCAAVAAHGDLKLKYKNARTYCVTDHGRVIAYRTGGVYFLEGCAESPLSSNYTNLAILVKSENPSMISSFINDYRERFKGVPMVQRFDDYKSGHKSVNPISTSLHIAKQEDLNTLFPTSINNAIKDFISEVLIKGIGLSGESLTLLAPELKILRELPIQRNFQVNRNIFVIGAATGRFRGILQSFCSGVQCGYRLFRGEL